MYTCKFEMYYKKNNFVSFSVAIKKTRLIDLMYNTKRKDLNITAKINLLDFLDLTRITIQYLIT